MHRNKNASSSVLSNLLQQISFDLHVGDTFNRVPISIRKKNGNVRKHSITNSNWFGLNNWRITRKRCTFSNQVGLSPLSLLDVIALECAASYVVHCSPAAHGATRQVFCSFKDVWLYAASPRYFLVTISVIRVSNQCVFNRYKNDL